MPTYTFINKENNEEKEMILSLSEREEFLANNPDWKQKLATAKIVSGVKGALAMTDDGWKETLGKIKSGSGRNNTIKL